MWREGGKEEMKGRKRGRKGRGGEGCILMNQRVCSIQISDLTSAHLLCKLVFDHGEEKLERERWCENGKDHHTLRRNKRRTMRR